MSSSSPPSILATLPFELLHLIAKCLIDYRDWFALSLTCRTFHVLTGPLLEQRFIGDVAEFMYRSIRSGRTHVIERGIVLGDASNSIPAREWTLHKCRLFRTAITCGNIDVVRVFLAHGIDPNGDFSVAGIGRPLTCAVDFAWVEIARLLLEAGAEVNNPAYRRRCGEIVWTVLSEARLSGNVKMAELLESYGAVEDLGTYICPDCVLSPGSGHGELYDEPESGPRLADGGDGDGDGDDDGDDDGDGDEDEDEDEDDGDGDDGDDGDGDDGDDDESKPGSPGSVAANL